MTNLIHALRRQLAMRTRERRTYAELARLGERDLADIGLTRADLRGVARAAARQGLRDVFAFDGGPRRPSAADWSIDWLTGRGLGLRTV